MNNSRIARWLLPGILLLTSGCFRPAGEAAVPTSDAAVSQFDAGQATPTELPLDAITPTAETGDTGEVLAITVVAPEDFPTPEGVTQDEPTSLPSDSVAITPLAPDAVTSEDTGDVEAVAPTDIPANIEQPSETPTPLTTFVIATPTATQQFITPSGPEGPVEISTLPPDTEPITSDSAPADTTPAAPENITSAGGDQCTYTVRSGDNLYRIALSNGVSLDAMRQANPNLTGENPVLMVGQELVLPNCGEAAPAQPTSAAPAVEPTAVNGELYTVRPGDTLFFIAQRNGVTVNDIIRANNLSNPDRLTIGQQLIIPRGE